MFLASILSWSIIATGCNQVQVGDVCGYVSSSMQVGDSVTRSVPYPNEATGEVQLVTLRPNSETFWKCR